jgi:hypothetical protein
MIDFKNLKYIFKTKIKKLKDIFNTNTKFKDLHIYSSIWPKFIYQVTIFYLSYFY